MRMSFIFGILASILATAALVQTPNLTGIYRCVQQCRPGFERNPAFVTQNVSSRAWIDWFSPTRIWIENWNQGAVYSPDGMIIQFDRGTIWVRDLGQAVPPRRK
jgi:hypothetical protein